MTIKEAIAILKKSQIYLARRCNKTDIYNAIGLAINALEAKATETSYDLYREETCDRKAHCYDYKYWHCIGCHGCKADMRGGKQ